MTSTQATASGNKAAEESFAALFEASSEQTDSLKEGDIVQGSVIKVNRDTVVVDIGYKSEGVIPASEFIDTSGKVSVNAGDRVDVLVRGGGIAYCCHSTSSTAAPLPLRCWRTWTTTETTICFSATERASRAAWCGLNIPGLF